MAGILIAVLCCGLYALGADEREAERIVLEAKKQELRLEADKSAAYLAEQKVKQDMIDKSNRAKDAIIAKGEYSPITATTERQPEISTKHSNSISEWWGKNVLRVHIPYEIKYMIDMSCLTPIVTDSGVLIEFGEDDFNVVVIPGTYSIMTPDKKETGIFPFDFDNEEVLALVSANAKMVAEEYAKDEEKLAQAVEETKIMLEGIAESYGSKVSFVEKRKSSGVKTIIDSETNISDKGTNDN